jgi:hypothetical protein
MTGEDNLIRFNSHKNIAIKETTGKKRSNKNTRCNGVRLTMPTSSGLPTSNNRGWTETLKNSFTLVELDPLHKNGLSCLSVIRVTTHSKIKGEWQHTQERWALQLKTVYKESRSRMIKLEEWREVRLSLNKNLSN